MSELVERLKARAAKVRSGTNDERTPPLLEEAAARIAELEADRAAWVEPPRLRLGKQGEG